MNRRNQWLLAVIGVLVMVIAGRVWLGLRAPPQLPPDAEVFKTVDALFTAVTAHSETHLAACEQRLAAYQQRGLLPAAAAKRLETVIATARAGDWREAAERLYEFMQGQRRAAAATSSAPQSVTS